MKNLLLLFAAMGLVFMTTSVDAQTRVKPKKKTTAPKKQAPRKNSPRKNSPRDYRDFGRQALNTPIQFSFGGLEAGAGGYLYDNSLSFPDEISNMSVNVPKSLNLTVHTVKLQAPLNIGGYRVKFKTSAAVDFNRFSFKEDISLAPHAENLTVTEEENVSYSKNFLKTTYVTVPLVMEYKLPNNIKIGGGAYGSYLVSSKMKQKSPERGKENTSGDFNLNKLQYGLTARVGYGALSLNAKYGLNGVFEKDNGAASDLKPFMVGVGFAF